MLLQLTMFGYATSLYRLFIADGILVCDYAIVNSIIGVYFDYIQFGTVKNKDAVNIHIDLVKIHKF